jgi:hypothetical protein
MEAFWAARLWAGLPDFEEQAAQGYCDDAEATGRLFKRADDVQWSIVEFGEDSRRKWGHSGCEQLDQEPCQPKGGSPLGAFQTDIGTTNLGSDR